MPPTARKAAAKKATAPSKAAPKKPTAGSTPQPPSAPPAGAVDDGVSIGQWVADLHTAPRRIEVFGRWWEFKQPTAGRGLRWDALLAGAGIRAALASMMFDEAAAPERTFTDQTGKEHLVPTGPGTAQADEFLTAATDWVPPEAAEEFWARMERAIFGPGEASAS